MVLTLDLPLVAALTEAGRRLGLAPEALALQALRERFLAVGPPIEPRDEWERQLLRVAIDCGVSLSNEALSREELDSLHNCGDLDTTI